MQEKVIEQSSEEYNKCEHCVKKQKKVLTRKGKGYKVLAVN